MPDDRLGSLSVRDVRLGGVIGERIDRTIDGNLKLLDWDGDFLAAFRAKATVDHHTGDSYIGLGKTLEGLVRLTAYRGDDDELGALRRRIVDATLAMQDGDGYAGLFVPASRISHLWDVHEMAYIAMALVADFELFDEAASIDAASRIADYIMQRLSADMAHFGWVHCITLDSCGLSRMLLALHRVTGEPRFVDYVIHKERLVHWNLPIVEGRHGEIEGHAYAYFCKCLAQLELYNILGDDRLLKQSHNLLDYITRRGGMVITGACGQSECWHSDQDGTGELGETCATAYLTRWLGKLARMEGDLAYGDLMERSIYNALFAAQSPDGRRIRYYAPFDGERVFWDLDTYCCPGNYRRIIAELPQMVAYPFDGGIAINLYAEAKIETDLAALTIATDYPFDSRVTIQVDPPQPAQFAVRLRQPRWCPAMSVHVNGEAAGAEIARQWQAGDRIEIDLPMPPRQVRGFEKQAGRAAVMRGPVVYSTTDDGDEHPFADPRGVATYCPVGDDDPTAADELLRATCENPLSLPGRGLG